MGLVRWSAIVRCKVFFTIKSQCELITMWIFLFIYFFIINLKELKSLQEAKDLRTWLELLKKMEGQLVETNIEVDPTAELAGV